MFSDSLYQDPSDVWLGTFRVYTADRRSDAELRIAALRTVLAVERKNVSASPALEKVRAL